jgi:O-antigen/teichoic acid export membrane protein
MTSHLKPILSNTLAQLVAKFFGAGLTLITTYFTIRLAGLPLYGDLTKILVMVTVGFTAIDFGLNAEGIRSSDSEPKMHQSTGNIMMARLFLSLLVILILNLVILVLPGGYSREVKSIFWLGSLAIIFQGIYASGNAWFQYKLSYWRSTVSVVVGSLVGTLLTLYFLRYSPTLSNLIFANTLGYLSMAVCSLLMQPKLDKLDGLYKLSAILPLLRRSLILGLILIFSVIASKIDTIILGIFRLSSEVGEYGFAYRIFDVILVLPVFVMNAIYPLSLREKVKNLGPTIIDKTTKYMAVIGIFTAICLWFAAPYVNLVKPGLVITTNVLRLLSISLPLFYVTAPLMWSLIAKKRDKTVLAIYVVAAIVNGALNLVFIPSYGASAAAINTGITELFIFLTLLYFTQRFP